MSIACCIPVVECVYCLACVRWAWRRCIYTAGYESENWGLATSEEFDPVPRLCRIILANYEDDLHNPIWEPPGGYGLDPDWMMVKKNHEHTGGRSSPYLIYIDHKNADVVLAIRGLNLAIESDYAVLLDNKLGQTKFCGGYVHNGLLKAAQWVFDTECGVLRELIEKNPNYRLTFAGHSLGAGIVALMTIYALQNRGRLGNIERKRIRCFAVAPPRCMSLNLAVRYADVINSVVLQDDFLPRTTMALEDVFKSLIWIGRFPPIVRTAVPVDGRFEHMVLSCNATADHAIIWIERESQRAFDLMLANDRMMEIPGEQRMERKESLAREHSEEYEAALQRAVALDIPHAQASYGTFLDAEEGETSGGSSSGTAAAAAATSSSWSFGKMRERLDSFVDRMFDVDEFGHMVFKKSVP
ncbi:unnamed protein product [Linum tenue]|uniref:Uncharacterized protein n=2 Tax=Linum tenue TaxID=586396 RepID=A0AAV0PHY7_9ROSI|nr:unnamed protein product [Linum tenue]